MMFEKIKGTKEIPLKQQSKSNVILNAMETVSFD
jgi:hypothetical protein